MHYFILAIPLWLFYIAVTANFEPLNLLVGVIVAGIITAVIRPPKRTIAWARIPGALWASVRYIFILLIDLVKSGVQVARIVLTPSLPINQGVVAIPALCDSEFATALSAHSITLTPGEMVIEMDKSGIMYTHMLDVSDADEQVRAAQERRQKLLQQIFI